MNKMLVLAFLVSTAAAGGFYLFSNTAPTINSFEECAAAGLPVMESYPRQCRAGEQTFVENIGNELEYIDLIRLSAPRPNQTVQSPLLIEGAARGSWFSEAGFSVKIFDANGQELGSALAQARGDWRTDEFVPFEAVLAFKKPATGVGALVLSKSNSSGLPENEDALTMPVKF